MTRFALLLPLAIGAALATVRAFDSGPKELIESD
jgi:hypothetical protein